MSGDSQRESARNSYLHLVRGDVPEDIARFEIESDPYANMLGTASQQRDGSHLRLVTDDETDEDAGRRSHPILTAVSLLLIVVWVILPAGLLILSRTGTWP